MKQEKIAGIFILISFILTLYGYFVESSLNIYSALCAWVALLLLFGLIAKKRLLYSLMALSIFMIIFSFIKGFDFDIQKAFSINQHLLTLLIGVGFLKLIASPKQGKVKSLPKGKNAFLKTYLGVHLFGSVINLSALILVADKLHKKSPLNKLQLVVLTRAFSSDAFWSPFFVAFAAAITYAPNLSASHILSFGLFLAIMAFVFTYHEINRSDKFFFEDFRGYPIHFETLYIPALLAIFVLVIHHYFPDTKMIILISLFSLLLTIGILPMKAGLKKAIKQLLAYSLEELPLMKNELALFLVAGVFGVSMSTILAGYNIDFPFEHFDAMAACLLLLVFILTAFMGIHPIISIAVVGSYSYSMDHTLFAIAFLMSWAITVASSPFSGLNLTIQARYGITALDIFKNNLSYAIKMYFVCVILLFILEYQLKI